MHCSSAEPISDADLTDVKGLVAQGRSIPALIVRSIIARLDAAESLPCR